VPDNVDPAFWVPSRENIKKYQNADLIFINGADYAKWLKVVSLPESKIVNTSESFGDSYIKIKASATHSHGPQGEHAHTDFAFTTWLDPILAIKQAEAIKIALEKLNPENKNKLQANFDNLKNDLLEIDKQLIDVFANDLNKPLIASHPVYQYLGARYNLNLISLHLEPDNLTDDNQLLNIKNLLNKKQYQWMIWEDRPLKETINLLKIIGINSIVFNPSANKPKDGDYLSVMHLNIKNIKTAYN
jgi:zinc transport system substrate-binding protein